MKLTDILKVAEDLLYQTLLWVILVPKTLLAVLRRPSWAVEYVATEHRKPAGERFDAFMSPLLLLVIVGVLPCILANTYWPDRAYSDFYTSRKIVVQTQSLNTEHRILLYGAIWTLLPMSFAIVDHLKMRQPITKSTFRPTIDIHCMKIAPVALIFIARFALMSLVDSNPIYVDWTNQTAVVCILAWLVYSDLSIARFANDTRIWKPIALTIAAIFVYYLLVIPVVLVVTHLGTVAQQIKN